MSTDTSATRRVITIEIESIAFESKTPDRGYTVRASYIRNSQDALIEVFKDGAPVREFMFPAYKVWNIAAHFSDIVDGEIANSDAGYREAGSDGLTYPGDPQPLDARANP